MVSPRHRNVVLYVCAVPEANVREIDENGKPLMAFRFVGKEDREVIPYGVSIPYHAHYISQLKLGTLLPMDQETAILAGVPWQTIS